ncbi:uncharacterized [Tachysurus ichikawai]
MGSAYRNLVSEYITHMGLWLRSTYLSPKPRGLMSPGRACMSPQPASLSHSLATQKEPSRFCVSSLQHSVPPEEKGNVAVWQLPARLDCCLRAQRSVSACQELIEFLLQWLLPGQTLIRHIAWGPLTDPLPPQRAI